MQTSSRLIRFALFLLAALTIAPTGTAVAQRGTLIEDLFRTIAETQLEREQRKRAEATEQARNQSQRPPQNRSSGTTNPYRTTNKSDNQRDLTKAPIGQRITIRSKEVGRFAERLGKFNSELRLLVVDLGKLARNQPVGRNLLPQVYQLIASSDSLIGLCDGLPDVAPLTNPYRQLDAQWRQLSFQLQRVTGISGEMRSHVDACNRITSDIERMFQLDPQIDRNALRDELIKASTYIQVVLDDLAACKISASQTRSLAHDVRLMQQRLLRAADFVPTSSSEDLAEAFTRFASDWKRVARELYRLDDPHINLRLDRISQSEDTAYQILLQQRPPESINLRSISVRLGHGVQDLMNQMTLQSLISLAPDDRNRLIGSARELSSLTNRVLNHFERDGRPEQIEPTFVGLQEQWRTVRILAAEVAQIDRSLIGRIDQSIAELGSGLGKPRVPFGELDYEQLTAIAASIEGTSEYLMIDIERYESLLRPSSFRRSIEDSSEDFYESGKRLHERLMDRESISSLRRETRKLIDAWQRLSSEIGKLKTNGVTGRPRYSLERSAAALAPLVAQTAAIIGVNE